MARSEEKGKDPLDLAEDMALLELAPRTTVQVIRAIIYEGPYSVIRTILGKGLSPGVHVCDADEESYHIKVRQAAIRVLDAEYREPVYEDEEDEEDLDAQHPQDIMDSLVEEVQNLRRRVRDLEGSNASLIARLRAIQDTKPSVFFDKSTLMQVATELWEIGFVVSKRPRP
jgi:hypothetical protein